MIPSIFLTIVFFALALWNKFGPKDSSFSEMLGLKQIEARKNRKQHKLFSNVGYYKRYAAAAEKHYISLSAGEIGLKVTLATAGVFFIALIGLRSIMLALGCAVVAFLLLPGMMINRKRAQMEAQITEQVPRAIFSMSSALKAGNTIVQAIEIASKDIEDPLGPELGRVYLLVKHGDEELEKALEQLYLRTNRHPIIKKIVLAFQVAHQAGGSIAVSLDGISKIAQHEIHTKEVVHAYSTQGKVSAVTLTVLPFVCAFAINSAIPGAFVEYFYETPQGKLLLLASVGLTIIGWVVILKVLQKTFDV